MLLVYRRSCGKVIADTYIGVWFIGNCTLGQVNVDVDVQALWDVVGE